MFAVWSGLVRDNQPALVGWLGNGVKPLIVSGGGDR